MMETYVQPNVLISSTITFTWFLSDGIVLEKYSNLCLFDNSGDVEKKEICVLF